MGTVGEGFGAVVSWNVRNLFVGRSDLEAALKEHNVVSAKVRDVSASSYLRRALEQAFDDGMIRKVGEDANVVSFACVTEQTDLKTGFWDGKMETSVTLRKSDGSVTFHGESKLRADIEKALRDQAGGLLTGDVATLIKDTVLRYADGVALRDGGGVYFVPLRSLSILDALETALRSVKNARGSIKINRLGVIAGVREAEDIAGVYADAVMFDLGRIKQELQERITDLVNTRPSVFKNRAVEIRNMLEQVRLYQTTLGTSVSFQPVQEAATRLLAISEKLLKACLVKRAEARQNKSLKG